MAEEPSCLTNIRRVNGVTVHKICSGQVILNLATAVKELVENSVDAGSTNIEVRLKEYGSELVEVSDNGVGVHESNFEGLSLKYHTSKLSEFEDLANVGTFGFRGEALSSLCALSDVVITTCNKGASSGTRLEFDHDGKLTKRSPCSRQVGTTVSLQNLFCTLPVRHKEFLHNVRREFNRMVQVLTAYCLISTKIRITCINQTKKGVVEEKELDVLVASLLGFQQVEPSAEVQEEYSLPFSVKSSPLPFRLEGYVSSCQHGLGRSSPDRQFLFVNGRPCDLPKVTRLINDVYHSFNRHQYPVVCLNILLEKEEVDINLTPDKRQVFVQNEKLLLASIKTSLLQLYSPLSSMLDQQGCSFQTSIMSHVQKKTDIDMETSPSDEKKGKLNIGLKRAFSVPDESKPQSESTVNIHKFARFKASLSSYEVNSLKVESSVTKEKELNTAVSEDKELQMIMTKEEIHDKEVGDYFTGGISDNIPCITRELIQVASEEYSIKSGKIDEELTDKISRTETDLFVDKVSDKNYDGLEEKGLELSLCKQSQSCEDAVNKPYKNASCASNLKAASLEDDSSNYRNQGTMKSPLKEFLCDRKVYKKRSTDKFMENSLLNQFRHKLDCGVHNLKKEHSSSLHTLDGYLGVQNNHSEADRKVSQAQSSLILSEQDSSVAVCSSSEVTVDEPQPVHKKMVILPFSLERLKVDVKKEEQKLDEKNKCEYRKFRAKITPSDNQSAEQELRKEFRKDMFSQMEVLGQFNLGFIIAKLGADLFIIDQHATDEKYNFEMLQKNTILETQKLLHPQTLELTASSEATLLENVEIFHKNGFEFCINEDATVGQRVKLISVPVSRNWTFGKSDIDELLFMLSDSPGVLCRPSRVRQMFASRACRKSVMIGTPLTISDMKKLVSHMKDIEQPWNCPHGRPTMRHLFNLNILKNI
ncbi:mismatch repair endonuclease PMS2-like [Limulus polyphemus]|uniref:Mismatch repair endonuclease PMS2-like n=1 Tax=Limulus polyphemus TaxID=6850 RepID=A0ABM1T5Q2_LIMPO|nr:mismatch repair endonuclease PMS2-like [Limulus polyphemus]